MPFYCYILECADGSYYTGWTTDPARRERQHNRGVGSSYTRMHCPVRLVYLEALADLSSALKRERMIKKLTHAQKRALVGRDLQGNLQGNLPQRHGDTEKEHGDF